MPRPILYFIRHGETDWNVAGRLQGRRDIPLNDKGRVQAAHCGKILRDLFAQRGLDAVDLDYVSSPLVRATETLALARIALGLPRDGATTDDRLAEIAFGDWEGHTIAQLRERDAAHYSQREHDKWHFVPPNGESYRQVAARMGNWYDNLTRNTVAAAHGGTARGLMAHLGIAKPAAAPLIDIAQGVVYVFEGGQVTRYA